MRPTYPALLLLLTFLTPVYGDMDSFRDDVESAEEQAPEKEPADPANPQDGKRRQKNLGDFLMELTFLLWFHHNSTTTFGPYPYSSQGFVRWAEVRQKSGILTPIPTGPRDFWFTGEVQALALDGLGYGGWASLKGHAFRFFGPSLEAWNLHDGKERLTGLRAGILVSLIQSDPINLGVYGQWHHWMGSLSRTGGTLGLEFRSYPFAPLTLQSRLGFQLFPLFTMGEMEFQAGVTQNSWEAFAGWRQWSLQTTGGQGVNQYNGPFIGIRKYL